MASLIVVRHPPVRDADLCYGQSNPAFTLTEEALEVLLSELKKHPWIESVELWTSPAKRCTTVARYLSQELGRPTKEEPLLWEISMGKWEGRRYSELENEPDFVQFMENWQTEAPPCGETIAQLSERVVRFLDALPPNTNHLVVAHAGIIRALLVHLHRLTWTEAMSTKVPHLKPHLFSV